MRSVKTEQAGVGWAGHMLPHTVSGQRNPGGGKVVHVYSDNDRLYDSIHAMSYIRYVIVHLVHIARRHGGHRALWRSISGVRQEVHEVRKALGRSDLAVRELPAWPVLHVPIVTSVPLRIARFVVATAMIRH